MKSGTWCAKKQSSPIPPRPDNPMRLVHTLWRFTPLLLLALAWEAISRFGLVSEYALPPFSDVVMAFSRLTDEGLWAHTAQSLYRGATGFACAVVVGVLAGVLMAWYRPVHILINPPAAQSLPNAEISTHSADDYMDRSWRHLENHPYLYRLPVTRGAQRFQRGTRCRPGSDLVGAQAWAPKNGKFCGRSSSLPRCPKFSAASV
jgi:hypothetical protein